MFSMLSMMRVFSPILMFLAAIAAGASCRVSTVQPITFPAVYQAEESGGRIAIAPACAVIRELKIVDNRESGHADGVRTIQDREGQSDIVMGGDVEDWLHAGVARALVASHFAQDPDAPLDLAMKLESIQIEEVAYRNSTFSGRVVLDVELVRPGTGDPVWTRRIDGFAQNYGRPGKTKNYQETVNHALDRAAANAINDEELRQRLCDVTAQAKVRFDDGN